MTMALEDLARHVEGLLDAKVVHRHIALAELTLVVLPEQIVPVLTALRDDSQCQFEQLIDICGVDYPERAKRFDVVYHLLSPRRNQRIRVKCETDADTPVPSVIVRDHAKIREARPDRTLGGDRSGRPVIRSAARRTLRNERATFLGRPRASSRRRARNRRASRAASMLRARASLPRARASLPRAPDAPFSPSQRAWSAKAWKPELR